MKMYDMDFKEFRKAALEWSSNSGDECFRNGFHRFRSVYYPSWSYYWSYLKAGARTAFIPKRGMKCLSRSKDIVAPLKAELDYHPKFLNGGARVIIDYVTTYITEIHGDFAKGFTTRMGLDFNMECWVCRRKIPGSDKYLYAHGGTIREAFKSLAEKFDSHSPLEERIKKFKAAFPDLDAKYKASDLYYWHGVVTGSCKFGRDHFCEENGIDVSKDEFTLREFFDLVLKNYNYGNDSIKELRNMYR